MYIETFLFNLKKLWETNNDLKKEKSWFFKKWIKLPISNVFLVKWNSLIIYILNMSTFWKKNEKNNNGFLKKS